MDIVIFIPGTSVLLFCSIRCSSDYYCEYLVIYFRILGFPKGGGLSRRFPQVKKCRTINDYKKLRRDQHTTTPHPPFPSLYRYCTRHYAIMSSCHHVIALCVSPPPSNPHPPPPPIPIPGRTVSAERSASSDQAAEKSGSGSRSCFCQDRR